MSECKYCKEEYYTAMNVDTFPISGLEIALNCKSADIRVRAYMDKDLFESQEFVRINYCPMCGRKLGD